jgi:hypothetical protein
MALCVGNNHLSTINNHCQCSENKDTKARTTFPGFGPRFHDIFMGCAVVAYCKLNTIVLFISCCEAYVALPKHLLGFSFIVLGGKPRVGSQNGNLQHGRAL